MRYFTDQKGPKGGPHENEFWVFSNSEMSITNSWIGKSRWKNGVIRLVSMFPSWVTVVKLFKKHIFLQFCADLSKKSKSIKAIYLYASERSRYTLSENSIVYCVTTYHFGDISVWSWRILLNFCCVSIFFDIIIVKFSWTVSQTSINHIIFWKSVMGTFRCIYVNCFNRLKFLAEVSTKL